MASRVLIGDLDPLVARGLTQTLIEEHFDERFYLHGEVSTVRRWLALPPPELAGSRARLLLARALSRAEG